MAVAACDLLPTGVATLPAPFRRLEALAVEAARGGRVVAVCRWAYLGAPGLVPALPGPGIAPGAARPGHTGPLRRLRREPAPCAAPVDDRNNGRDHRAPSQCTVAPTRLGGRNPLFDISPCGISEVCGVWIGVPPQSVRNCCHLWTTFQTASQTYPSVPSQGLDCHRPRASCATSACQSWDSSSCDDSSRCARPHPAPCIVSCARCSGTVRGTSRD